MNVTHPTKTHPLPLLSSVTAGGGGVEVSQFIREGLPCHDNPNHRLSILGAEERSNSWRDGSALLVAGPAMTLERSCTLRNLRFSTAVLMTIHILCSVTPRELVNTSPAFRLTEVPSSWRQSKK